MVNYTDKGKCKNTVATFFIMRGLIQLWQFLVVKIALNVMSDAILLAQSTLKYLQEKAEHDKLREKIQKQNNNDFHLNSNGIEWAGKHRNRRR